MQGKKAETEDQATTQKERRSDPPTLYAVLSGTAASGDEEKSEDKKNDGLGLRSGKVHRQRLVADLAEVADDVQEELVHIGWEDLLVLVGCRNRGRCGCRETVHRWVSLQLLHRAVHVRCESIEQRRPPLLRGRLIGLALVVRHCNRSVAERHVTGRD